MDLKEKERVQAGKQPIQKTVKHESPARAQREEWPLLFQEKP